MGDEWEDKICGTCRYHQYDGENHIYICNNDNSETGGLVTDYDDHCEEWGGK